MEKKVLARLKLLLMSALVCLAILFCVILGKVYENQIQPIDAAIVLEGAPARFRYAAKYAKQHPNLPIYISSQPNIYQVYLDELNREDVPIERFRVRKCASDTVTNFTCIRHELRKNKFRHVAIITSSYHMPRALLVGRIVLGKVGIAVTPLSVVDKSDYKESLLRVLRDLMRGIIL